MKPGRQPVRLSRVTDHGSPKRPLLDAPVVLILSLCLIVLPRPLFSETSSRSQAADVYEQAVQLRTTLEGKPKRLRTANDYQKVINKYRSVYYQFPSSSKADDALLAVAELYQLMGNDLKDRKHFEQAIKAYLFLEREYPASRYGPDGLFAAAEIYLNDLHDAPAAKEVFTDLLKRYPHAKKARNARARLDDLRAQLRQATKSTGTKSVASKNVETPSETSRPTVQQSTNERPETAEAPQLAKNESSKSSVRSPSTEEDPPKQSVISVIRYWNTESYTRLVVNTGREVKYAEGRLDKPARVFIDIQNAHLSAALTGKTIVLADGYVSKIRFGQPSETVARIVLDLGSFKDCQVVRLSNPSRIVVDVQGAGRGEQSKSEQSSTPKWKVSRGEPLADELDLQVAVQSVAVKGSEEKSVSVKSVDPATTGDSIHTKQERSKPGAETPKMEEIKTATAKEPARESDVKTIARASIPKSDGTRSLIRTLGLKVGRIVIDAGHGGHDTGTVGPSGLQEKDLVLDIALKLKALVEEKLGSEVLLTRSDDTFVPLEERTAMANHSQADLFLSIHANSSRSRRVSGVETYFLDFASSLDAEEIAARENSSAQKTIFELQDLVQKIALKEKIDESRELAQIVQKSVTAQLQKTHSQTRDRGVKQAPFIVLIGANMPSILSEISFVSNPADEKLLKSSNYRQKLAEALCRGIEAYAEALGGIKTARNLP